MIDFHPDSIEEFDVKISRPLKKDYSFDGKIASWVVYCGLSPFVVVFVVCLWLSAIGIKNKEIEAVGAVPVKSPAIWHPPSDWKDDVSTVRYTRKVE